MEFVIDILDDRLEAVEAGGDDRERLRRYLDLWRAGAIAPLGDPGVVVIATLDDGPRPRRVVANDGEGGRVEAGRSPRRGRPGPSRHRRPRSPGRGAGSGTPAGGAGDGPDGPPRGKGATPAG